MKTAKFEYKCRRCGMIDQNPCTSERNAEPILIAIALDVAQPQMMGGTVDPLSVHGCKDGGQGLSDLIGFAVLDE